MTWSFEEVKRAYPNLFDRRVNPPLAALRDGVFGHRLERAGVATAADHAAFIAELSRGVPVPV